MQATFKARFFPCKASTAAASARCICWCNGRVGKTAYENTIRHNSAVLGSYYRNRCDQTELIRASLSRPFRLSVKYELRVWIGEMAEDVAAKSEELLNFHGLTGEFNFQSA